MNAVLCSWKKHCSLDEIELHAQLLKQFFDVILVEQLTDAQY